MDVKKILDIVHQTDPEVYEKLSPRRQVLKSFGTKVAAAALPFALGSLFNKAYGKTTDILYDSLAFALKLEYLEAEFYRIAVEVSDVYPVEFRAGIQKLAADEAAHVAFLKNFLLSTAGTAPEAPSFDFSGGRGGGQGPFEQVFQDTATFLVLAQVFEDMAVRAYKGQMPRIGYNDGILQTMFNIHSVEARHAAHIRMMRRRFGHGVKPWITGTNSDIESNFVQRVYNGEALNIQGGIALENINGYTITQDQVTQAFDEPLNETDINLILEPFIAS